MMRMKVRRRVKRRRSGRYVGSGRIFWLFIAVTVGLGLGVVFAAYRYCV